ncbi:MAG: TonB-dependent receptor [Burkholderiales bacterium]|nr:TonB-dependent receptor [Burkholderiales bacterium]
MKPKCFSHCIRILGALSPLVLPAASATQLACMVPVVITATRIAQPVSSLLSDLRIIDSEDIANAGAQSLIELLQSHGGIEIAATGGPGQVAGVFIRGTNANHVVVLIDGVRVNSATSGTNAFENIPLSQVERIEIVRGPASSLYGADAIGGVIQIFTRRGGNRIALAAGAGTWNTQRASVALARESGATRLGVQAGYESTRAFSAANERNAFSYDPDDDPYRNKNLSAHLGHTWAPGQELALRALMSEGTAHFDSGPGSDDVNRQRLATWALESRNQLHANWSSTVRLARGSDDIVTLGSFPAEFRTDQDQFTWQNDLAAAGGRFALGLEYRREKVASTTEFSQSHRSIRSFFAGYSGAFGANLLQASVRRDDNSQFGARNTGNLAWGYRITPAWRVSAAAGTAFKAPSFNDLYFVSPFFSGNPDLQPERATSGELAANFDHEGMRAGLTLYRSRVLDLIAVDPTFTTVINVNEAKIRGATLHAAADLGDTRVKAEVTREEATDAATGRLLPRRARTFGSLALARTAGPLRLGAEIVASGARYDSLANAPSSRLTGYALLNLRAAYTFAPAYAVSVRWNNVFNRDYELVQGYNTPGANLFVSLDYTPQ